MSISTSTLDHVIEAIEAVLALDLPDECWPDFLAEHAAWKAGAELDDDVLTH